MVACSNAKMGLTILALLVLITSLVMMQSRAIFTVPRTYRTAAAAPGGSNPPAHLNSIILSPQSPPPPPPPQQQQQQQPQPGKKEAPVEHPTSWAIDGGADNSGQPKYCGSTKSEDAVFLVSEVPQSMSTLANITGIVDPSTLSREVSLPGQRENWCPTSPCLTVTNATQHATEMPHFKGWLTAIRQNWTDTFDPLIFEHEGELYWYTCPKPRSSTIYMRNASHGFRYMDAIAPLENATGCEHWVNASGNVLLWFNFHYGNYGHFIHDHAPALIALLDILGSSVSWVALPYSELAKKWLCWFDATLLERVIFYPPGKVVCSNATTLTALSKRGEGGARWRMPVTISLLNQKAHARHYRAAAEPRPKIVFASRNSTTTKHGRALVNEQQVLDSVRRMMALHNRPEELVVYNGDNVSYDDQFALFSTASMVMGPHGSAMSNVLWSRGQRGCQNPVQVIEFVGSMVSGPQVQAEYHGYYELEGGVPWVSYHMVTFQDNSTNVHTSVNPNDVESVLSYIWGGRDTGSTSCYPSRAASEARQQEQQ